MRRLSGQWFLGSDDGLIAPNQSATVILELLFSLALLIVSYQARHGKAVRTVRRVAGIGAIDQALDHAALLGRPVHFSPGIADFGDAATLAALAILSHVARTCASKDIRLIVTNRMPNVHAAAEDNVRQAHAAEGKADSFIREDVRYIANDQFAYATGAISIIATERVASSIMMGYFAAEAMVLAEGGNISGALQIAGTASAVQLPFFVMACDYVLIGEEMFAASAYLSKDPVQVADLALRDVGKIAAALYIIIAALLLSSGNTLLVDLLRK